MDEDSDIMEVVQPLSQASKKRKMEVNGPSPTKKMKLVEDVSAKKSFLKNRSSQNTEQELNLSEGISRGMKNVKIDNMGVGSRRVLEDKSQKTNTQKTTRVSTGGVLASQHNKASTILEDRRESNTSMEIEMDDLEGIISVADQAS